MTEILDRSLNTLRSTPPIIEALVSRLTPDELCRKPSDERWSVSEILVHLRHVEERNLGLRVRRMCREDQPLFVDYDQTVEYRKGTYSGISGEQALREFKKTRNDSLTFLEGLKAADLSREAMHHEVGIVTVIQILSLWAFHDLSHIRQIAELVKAISFWRGMGSLQKYYSVAP